MNPLDSQYLNVAGVGQLINSTLNKVDNREVPNIEGASNDIVDELELKMDDEELLLLKTQWEVDNKTYNEDIKTRQGRNKTYYLGRQSSGLNAMSSTVPDNLLFEAIETYIPSALAKNPEPVVYSDNTDVGIELSKEVKTMLQYLGDTLVLRQKLKRVVKHGQIYFIGAVRHFWDAKTNEIGLRVVLPQTLFFDKDGYIDEAGDYYGKFLGERITKTAAEVITMFPKSKDYISGSVAGKLGTSITYTEWSTPLYSFYTYKDEVLGKYRNPNWNYDHKVPTGEFDEEKNDIMEIVPGRNHFAYPKISYTFFSCFNLGEHPHDDTTLIEQNIPNQDVVVDRNAQITYNLQNNNNGLVFSGDYFNKEDAKEGNSAVRRGVGIFQPTGDVRSGVLRLPASSLPDGLFDEVERRETVLRSIFGTQGISAQGQSGEDTVRGKILNQSYDTTRIGGGIGDVIAQVADNIFNHQVQLMYVYYDEKHVGSILGTNTAVEYVELQRSDLMAGPDHRKLIVSVSPDSMKPKDELTQMNLATDMWANGSLDPLSYYEMLNMPDPQKLLERLILWKTNPMAMLQGAQGGSPQGQAQPNQPPAPPVSTAEAPPSDSLAKVPIPKI